MKTTTTMMTSLKVLFRLFATLIIVLGISSCTTQKKATDWFKKNDDKLAELCVERFPTPPAEYIKGDTVVVEKVIELPAVEIECPEPTVDNPRPVVKCPACKEIIRTITRVDTIKQPDNRQIFILETQLKTVKESLDKMTTERNNLIKSQSKSDKWKWWFIILVIVNAGYVFWKLKK